MLVGLRYLISHSPDSPAWSVSPIVRRDGDGAGRLFNQLLLGSAAGDPVAAAAAAAVCPPAQSLPAAPELVLSGSPVHLKPEFLLQPPGAHPALLVGEGSPLENRERDSQDPLGDRPRGQSSPNRISTPRAESETPRQNRLNSVTRGREGGSRSAVLKHWAPARWYVANGLQVCRFGGRLLVGELGAQCASFIVKKLIMRLDNFSTLPQCVCGKSSGSLL